MSRNARLDQWTLVDLVRKLKFLTRLSLSSGSVPLLCFSFTKTTISLFLGGFWRVRNCLAHRLKRAFTVVLIGELVSYRADRYRDAIVSCLQFCVVEFGLCCTFRGIGEYGWTKDGILSHQNGFFLSDLLLTFNNFFHHWRGEVQTMTKWTENALKINNSCYSSHKVSLLS